MNGVDNMLYMRLASANNGPMILYEDFATGLRARKVGDFLAEELSAKGRFQPELWRCDVLQEPPLQGRVARAVARADLLILSVHRHLPAVPTGALGKGNK